VITLNDVKKFLQCRPQDNARWQHLKGATLGQALALIVIIALGQKGLSGANTLAYLACSSVMKKKHFLTLTTGQMK
jgi:hypothetical protein